MHLFNFIQSYYSVSFLSLQVGHYQQYYRKPTCWTILPLASSITHFSGRISAIFCLWHPLLRLPLAAFANFLPLASSITHFSGRISAILCLWHPLLRLPLAAFANFLPLASTITYIPLAALAPLSASGIHYYVYIFIGCNYTTTCLSPYSAAGIHLLHTFLMSYSASGVHYFYYNQMHLRQFISHLD